MTSMTFSGEPNHVQASADRTLDYQAALDHVDGDEELLHDMITVFLEYWPETKTALHTAVRAQDAEGLAQAAHSLKGAVSSFGAVAVRDTAQRLEILGRSGDLATAQTHLDLLEAEMVALIPALMRATRPD